MEKEVTIKFDNSKAAEPVKATIDGDFGGGGFIGQLDKDHSIRFELSEDVNTGKLPFVPSSEYGCKTVKEFFDYARQNRINFVGIRIKDSWELTHFVTAILDEEEVSDPEEYYYNLYTNISLPVWKGSTTNEAVIEFIPNMSIDSDDLECELYQAITVTAPTILRSGLVIEIFCLK